MPARPYIGEPVRREVFLRCGGRCFYCEKKLCFDNRQRGLWGAWEIDHLVPKSQGGRDDLSNLRAACVDCNREKSDRSVREYADMYGEAPRCAGEYFGGACPYDVAPGNRRFCSIHGK